ncbi:L-asparagine permease [Cutibacterium acnes JCM 18918]|nr:L-asparagine permease [Cutibacterium acnes JCM 18918]
MNLAGIGIAGTWAMVLLAHTRFVSAVRRGKDNRPEYRMPGAPVTNYISLAFLLIVVLSNVTSESGRWTLASSPWSQLPWSPGGTQSVTASNPTCSTTWFQAMRGCE